MSKDYKQERWVAYASPTYLTQVNIIKGYVEYSGGSAFIMGRCVPASKVWDTEEEAKKEALRLIESRMQGLLVNMELLNNLSKEITGEKE